MDFRDEYYQYTQERAAKAALRDAKSLDTVGAAALSGTDKSAATVGEAALSGTDKSAATVGEDIKKCTLDAYQYAGFLYFTNMAFAESVRQFFTAIDGQPKKKFEEFAQRLAKYRSVVASYDNNIVEFRNCLKAIDPADWEKWIKQHPVKKTQ